MSESTIDDYRFGRARFLLGKLVAMAICEPQLRLGRRRHDNHCDECGDSCGPYAMDKLDFPLEDLAADATSKREKIQAMVGAEYRRVCLNCGDDLEGGEQ